ncbi:MAG: hypothetical protein ACRCTZ_18910 [Sarcina sp.]
MNNKKFNLVTIVLAIVFIILAILAVMSFSKKGKAEISSILGLGSNSTSGNVEITSNPNSLYYNAGSYVASQSNNNDNGSVINMHSVNYSPEVSFLAQSANNN